jgi:hydroxymethylbilane synthase
MVSHEIRIGTRGSPLALFQANWVRENLLQKNPRLEVTLTVIKTTGDKIQDAPLAKVGGKGLFVKEIEEALLEERIDLAVHSIKDVPTEFPEGLHLAAVTKREDPRDAFISKDETRLQNLRQGAKIGTSSLRRQAQLLHFRPDLEMIPLRGNLDTRLKKLDSMNLDAIVLALAGVKRLGFDQRVTEILPVEISLPAIGQGALGIEMRVSDSVTEPYVQALNDPDSAVCVLAERAFLKKLEGGCQVPIAAYGRKTGSTLRLEGMVATVDGKTLIRHHVTGSVEEQETLGMKLAEILLDMGAQKILDEIYGRLAPSVSLEDRNNE